MLKDNLIMLRKLSGYSQEHIAEKIGISRQAYAKWESGATIPDIDKADSLAKVYGVTIDSGKTLNMLTVRSGLLTVSCCGLAVPGARNTQ